MENFPEITIESSFAMIITNATLFSNQLEINHTESKIYDKVQRTVNTEWELERVIIITMYPIIVILGTIGNILLFTVMRGGSLKHSSACFYMSILALADTGMWIFSTD